jgi:hypothetical protein
VKYAKKYQDLFMRVNAFYLLYFAYEQYHAFWCGTACGTRTGMIEAME